MSSQIKLPIGDFAIMGIAKLRDYCLNPAHPRGRHKARVSVQLAREAQLRATATNTERYTVDFGLEWGGRPAITPANEADQLFCTLKGGLQWLK